MPIKKEKDVINKSIFTTFMANSFIIILILLSKTELVR